jgi:translation initiation factor 3 subunit F
MFTPIPVEVLALEPEAVGLDILQKTKFSKLRHVEPVPDLARVAEGTQKLESLLDTVIEYVESVISGKRGPDNAVGRRLLELINTVPRMSTDTFEKMINSNMKASLFIL